MNDKEFLLFLISEMDFDSCHISEDPPPLVIYFGKKKKPIKFYDFFMYMQPGSSILVVFVINGTNYDNHHCLDLSKPNTDPIKWARKIVEENS